jgi:chorismate lyase/3-hydroxybenzoate synthase
MQFSIHFGNDASGIVQTEGRIDLRVSVPVLHGAPSIELLNSPHARTRHQEPLLIVETDSLQIGCAVLGAGSLEERARAIYDAMLSASQGYHLLRAWNFVPHINEASSGLENYRQFCIGRANAFAATGKPKTAASAVGIDDDVIIVYYLAHKCQPHHFENPEQVPAYQYPSEYGPKAPSFARASVCHSKAAMNAFISGTAAIKGHQSLHSGDLTRQTDTTLDNLELMVAALGIDRSGPFLEDTTIYLREASGLDSLVKILKSRGLYDKTTRILKADICREELLVEIETHTYRSA